MWRTPFLLIGSVVWGAFTALNRCLFRLGLRQAVRLPLRTLSVGNIEVGGTGKTPVVAAIAREALERGLVPVILTRGYGGRWEKAGGVIAPAVESPQDVDPALTGDEPALLHRLVPAAWIGIGANRVASFERVRLEALKRGGGLDLVILDDGLQHLRIARDLDIVLLTSSRPWQKLFREWPLPAPLSRSLCVWSKGGRVPFGLGSRSSLRLRWTLPSPDESERKNALWLVTGVASASEVRESLERSGWSVDAHSVRADHSEYSQDWLKEIQARAEASGLRLATTGKDWVKWRRLGVDPGSVRVFEPQMEWDRNGRKAWLEALWDERS